VVLPQLDGATKVSVGGEVEMTEDEVGWTAPEGDPPSGRKAQPAIRSAASGARRRALINGDLIQVAVVEPFYRFQIPRVLGPLLGPVLAKAATPENRAERQLYLHTRLRPPEWVFTGVLLAKLRSA
jgi:hypothetical protein